MKFGVNVFSLRYLIRQYGEEVWEKIKSFGFCHLEGMAFGSKAEYPDNIPKEKIEQILSFFKTFCFSFDNAPEKYAQIRKVGLDIECIHTNIAENDFVNPDHYIERFVDFAAKTGINNFVLGLDRFFDKWEDITPKIKYISSSMRAKGLNLIYHNHADEWKRYKDTTYIEYLLDNCEDLLYEPDVGWIYFAQVNPLVILKKYKNKIYYIHLKDMIIADGKPNFCGIGSGEVPIKETIEFAAHNGLEDRMIIDQDNSSDMLADLEKGAGFIKRELVELMKKDYEQRHYDTLRALGSECVVMLKKDGSFPCTEKKIALFGSGARHTLRGGSGGGIVEVKSFSTVEQGLLNVGYDITSKKWLDDYDKILEEAKQNHQISVQTKIATEGLTGLGALSVAMPEPEYQLALDGEGDTAIYVLTRLSGEGGDRSAVVGDVYLSDTEIRDIKLLAKKYKKFLLLLNVSGVVDLSPIVFDVGNIMLISQLGSATGDIVADIISGKSYPSGKLASTWAKYEDYSSLGDINPREDTRYKEGIYVGYRYFDTAKINPLFPFGYGLGYTDFEISLVSLKREKSLVKVVCEVINKGNYSGKEVVQLYVTKPEQKLDQPYQVLSAFAKTKELASGEKEDLELTFDFRDLASFDKKQSANILERGDYILRLGNSSRNTEMVGVLRLDEEKIIEKVGNLGGEPDFDDYIPAKIDRVYPYTTSVILVPASELEEKTHNKKELNEKAKLFAESLSNEELANICVGYYYPNGKHYKNKSKFVAGAVGQTTMDLEDKGLPTTIMSDGPAGLHIARVYGIDEDGIYPAVSEETKEVKKLLPPDILEYLLKLWPDAATDSRKGEMFEQNCTAIPIETALASSWNPSIATACGKLIGEEMWIMGTDFFLAPALNIHRHIICGRDFEYFSEDPLISGKMAASVVKGVQGEGKFATLKHFVCNEQENNRLNSNSIVSQRALREIYGKAFEIALGECNPVAVMTSYNLLNGTHTSERKDLVEELLRTEYGFCGMVMSDWVGFEAVAKEDQKYPRAKAGNTLLAGNDLMMPGSKGDYDGVLECLNNSQHPLTREDLVRNASRIIEKVWICGERKKGLYND